MRVIVPNVKIIRNIENNEISVGIIRILAALQQAFNAFRFGAQFFILPIVRHKALRDVTLDDANRIELAIFTVAASRMNKEFKILPDLPAAFGKFQLFGKFRKSATSSLFSAFINACQRGAMPFCSRISVAFSNSEYAPFRPIYLSVVSSPPKNVS